MVSLTPITEQDVSRDVLKGFPGIHTYRNALAIPKLQGPLSPDAGLFDETGLRISSGDLLHGYPTFRKMTQEQFYNRNWDDAIALKSDAVYGGSIELHYGHFITECLNTLWYITTHQNTNDIVVFLSSRTLDEIYATPWAASLLIAANVPKERARIVTTPVQFRRLIVPGKAFLEDSFAFTGYASFCQELGRRLAAPWHGTKPIYLSRERVRGGSIRMENEHELSRALFDRGFDIIFPEELSVGQQIGLYCSKNFIVGQIGSSFHTSIFSKNTNGIALSNNASVRRSFYLMDAAHDCSVKYYQMNKRQPASNHDANFIARYTVDSVEEMAEEIVSLFPAIRASRRDVTDAPKIPAHLVSIKTKYQEELFIDADCLVRSKVYKGSDSGIRVLGVVIGSYLLLSAGSFPRDKLPFLFDRKPALIWGFKMEAVAGQSAVYLRSGISGRYLTIPPSQTGVAVQANGAKRDMWEEVFLQKEKTFQSEAIIQMIITTYLSDKTYLDDWVKCAISELPALDWMSATAV